MKINHKLKDLFNQKSYQLKQKFKQNLFNFDRKLPGAGPVYQSNTDTIAPMMLPQITDPRIIV